MIIFIYPGGAVSYIDNDEGGTGGPGCHEATASDWMYCDDNGVIITAEVVDELLCLCDCIPRRTTKRVRIHERQVLADFLAGRRRCLQESQRFDYTKKVIKWDRRSCSNVSGRRDPKRNKEDQR